MAKSPTTKKGKLKAQYWNLGIPQRVELRKKGIMSADDYIKSRQGEIVISGTNNEEAEARRILEKRVAEMNRANLLAKARPIQSLQNVRPATVVMKRRPNPLKISLEKVYPPFSEKRRKLLARQKEDIQAREIETARKERLSGLSSEVPYQSFGAENKISQYLRERNRLARAEEAYRNRVPSAEGYTQYVQEQVAAEQRPEVTAKERAALNKLVQKKQKAASRTVREFGRAGEGVTKAGAKAFKSVTGAYGYRYKASKSLLAMASAFGTPVRGGQTGPGRPKGVYIYRSPFTGRPIPASQFYKEMRQFKKIQAQTAQGVDVQQIRKLAARGIPPEQAQQIVNQAQLRSIQTRPPQTQPPQYQPQYQQIRRLVPVQQQYQPQPPQPQVPNGTVIPRGTVVWKWRRGVVGSDWGLFGRQQKVYGLPESFWN